MQHRLDCNNYNVDWLEFLKQQQHQLFFWPIGNEFRWLTSEVVVITGINIVRLGPMWQTIVPNQ